MFVDDADFDEDDIQDTYKKNDSVRPTPVMSSFRDFEDDDDDFQPTRNAGGDGSSSNSRARMLAQQREIQLKKRQSSVQSGGMVRSSIDSSVSGGSPMRQSADNQFTPAIRQFSAPKALRTEGEAPSNSEFSRSKVEKSRPKEDREDRDRERERERSKPPRNNYSDDEDDSRDRRAHRSKGRVGRDDDDDEEDYRRYNSRGNRNRDDSGDESYQWGGERQRGGGGGRGRGADAGARDPRDDRGYNRERDRDSDRERQTGRGWQGAHQSQPREREQPRAAYEERVPRAPAVDAPPAKQMPPDLSNIHRFMTTPLPKECGVVQCYIRRNKSGTNKLYPIYSLYLKEGDVFLMASKKRPKNKTSNYLVSLDQNDLNRSGSNYLGKLRSNFVGTEFQVFDNGENPKDMEDDMSATGSRATRCELGVVMYAANVLGSRGPRKMQVAIPGLDEDGKIIKWKDSSGVVGSAVTSGDDMMSRMKDRNFRDLIYLINKPPRWNDQVGAYVLNFNGRVTMASVKNFQLVDPDEQNSVVLQFGRVGKDDFTMDMQWPISPFQAFAITLSSFDSKIACD